jgi:hypothetical protein
MKVAITKGLDKDEAKDMRAAFNAAQILRKRIISILTENIDAKRRDSVNNAGYESPNWALKQADTIGYERAVRELISLLS